ncbi:MAG: hypothetical protein QOJ02_2716 [Acidobacteriota bacterium]|jgi:hypothetical protein|nr:hypothetical protein [Acidobacteriota bacterium]
MKAESRIQNPEFRMKRLRTTFTDFHLFRLLISGFGLIFWLLNSGF